MHARTFLCREALWAQFEEIAREQGAPIDEVLSEAMRSYARQRSYGTDEPNSPGAHDYGAENAPDLARTNAVRQMPPARTGPGMPNRMPPIPAARSGVGMPLPPPPAGRGNQARMASTGAMPAPPPRRGGPLAAPPPPPPPQSMRGGAPHRAPPPQPQGYAQTDPDPQPWQQQPPPPQRSRGPARLSLTYEGRHVEVTKERFVLGRSKTQADLVLEDPNVSRQHAAIELQGGEWMLVDLGSTNGCYIDGQRVTTRPIQDGDLIEITTHQIHCTMR